MMPAVTLDILGALDGLCDICCGSGAVGMRAIERGLPPERLLMVDAGPWGAFWRQIGEGTFPIDDLRSITSDLESVGKLNYHLALDALRVTFTEFNTAVFLVLQAGAFGCKAVSHDGIRWVTPGFFRYDAKRGGMKPWPAEIVRRVEEIATRMRGIRGVHAYASSVIPPTGWTVYIDPPYPGTTGYGPHKIDAVAYAKMVGGAWVAGSAPLSNQAWQLSKNRSSSGIGGNGTCNEYLSWIRGAA